jgi:hypothetical protein
MIQVADFRRLWHKSNLIKIIYNFNQNGHTMLTIYTFGYENMPTDIKFDKVFDLHKLGVTQLDHSGHNERIKQMIIQYINKYKLTQLGIQCQHGLYRSVEMASDIVAKMGQNATHISISSIRSVSGANV